MPIFIFDTSILNTLESKNDRRVDYIHQTLSTINLELKKHHSRLHSFYGEPLEIFKILSREYDIQSVFCNRDYEPQAIQRDTEIFNYFKSKSILFKTFKDQVIFDKNEIIKNDDMPYSVYTPYAKKWKESLTKDSYKEYKSDFSKFLKSEFSEIIALKDISFLKTGMCFYDM